MSIMLTEFTHNQFPWVTVECYVRFWPNLNKYNLKKTVLLFTFLEGAPEREISKY